MKYFVYIIENKLGQKYKGITDNLEKRLYYHNNGLSIWTRYRGPFKLIYKEEFDNKCEALKREKFFKSGVGREFLKSIRGVAQPG